MDILKQLLGLIFKRRYWLIIAPLIVAIVAIYKTRNLERTYEVSTTLYTGVASGYSIEAGMDGLRVDWNSVSNSIDNIISIIQSKTTLNRVALKLYAQHMIYGDSLKDNNYIQAKHYREVYKITPHAVRRLIDKSSIERTLENLLRYEETSSTNFVFGLFNWYHPYYSYHSLSKIEVRRLRNSDMLEINYSANDPGVAYHTLELLLEEFKEQYEVLRFTETNNVIDYFRRELARLGRELKESEDALTRYYVEKRIINYPEQTKHIAALGRDFELLYSEVLLRYAASKDVVDRLAEKIEGHTKILENNSSFIEQLNRIAKLSNEVMRRRLVKEESDEDERLELARIERELEEAEERLREFTKEDRELRRTREGIALSSFVDEWVTEVIEKEKSGEQLKVMVEVRESLYDQYTYYSPVGVTISRMEREIGFTENSYLATLQALNAALLRQKNLQMTSASFKALNPPIFPISPKRTGRRQIVLLSYLGTLFLLLGYFIFVELFDTTLTNKRKAERLLSIEVLGLYPKKWGVLNSSSVAEREEIATIYLANSIVNYLSNERRPNVINLIPVDYESNELQIAERLQQVWSERGLNVVLLNWESETAESMREKIVANNLSEIYNYTDEDLLLVLHQPYNELPIPTLLLHEASLNLFIASTETVWHSEDEITFNRLKEQIGEAPFKGYLTNAKREALERVLGPLPPYTFLNKARYGISQFT